ncbi:hypothetical protein DH2020_047721 [Rehmannia glutinosa]|uniref:Transcription factor 25 n=1 Tax=Rehmannia glutinosa TaxID=99300 RepID=A0ABR0U7T9_REHGL
MSARMMKKVLKEQEAALQQQQQLNSEDDSGSPHSLPPTRNHFDLLEDEDDNSSSETCYDHHSDQDVHLIMLFISDGNCQQEKGKIAVETSKCAIASKHSSTEKDAAKTGPMPNVKSKKKKNKKKIGEDYSPITENDARSSNLMLESLSLGASSSGHQLIAPNPAKSKLVNIDSNDIMLKKQQKCSVLQVDPKFLSAENELRRIFGPTGCAKFTYAYQLETHESAQDTMFPSLYQISQLHQKPIASFVQLSSSNDQSFTWNFHFRHNLRDSEITDMITLLGLIEDVNLVEGADDVRSNLESADSYKSSIVLMVGDYGYVHSSSYAQAQRGFEAAKAIHDLNGIGSILLNHPYHIDSLITLADYFKFTGEHQMSADATAKCLYAMECAWHPLFTPWKNCQLKYVHDTNKPFFSSVFTHMKNMDRGCHRSALEICKLLLSLDSDDPMGAMLCIDYYSLRAEEYAWLERFAEEYKCDNSLWLFPNFSFSLAVCRFYLERDEHANNRQMDIGKAGSFDLMNQALMLHPSVLKKLVVKVPLKDRKWTTLLKHSFFGSEQTGSPSLDHLIAIYVERSYLLWRLLNCRTFCMTRHFWSLRCWESKDVTYSHLLVSEFSDSVPTMPPDNLQDFIVDQRGGVEHREQFPDIPENHMIRDVSNRNALAVLFESMLPWVNYGTGEGEHIQNDLPAASR